MRNRKALKDLEQRTDMIRFVFLDHSGCCGKNSLYGARVGAWSSDRKLLGAIW